MEIRDYWQIVRRRWSLVLLCVVLATGLAALATWQTTPLYASSTKLLVSTASADTSDASTGGLYATQRVQSYVDLVDTRKLAETVSTNLGGDIDPDDLRDLVTAEAVPETVNLVIEARYSDAVTARDIAQAYAEALSDLVADIETPSGGGEAPIRASIVDNAEIEDSAVSPDVPRNLGLGVVIGLLLGIVVAVVRDLLDTSISTPEDLAEVTARPVLGNIGNDAAAVKKAPATALAEASPWAEAFRVLRTNMQYVEVDHDHRVFVVSSSLPGEGKSTTAANLAITLAMAGETVCLVECDLRRPNLADKLGVDDSVGTTSVLIGRVTLDDALQPYGTTGLQVLACGPRPPNPSELLQSQHMETMIGDLRSRFAVVLLDAPPLLPVTDAALLAARADGLLAVVRHAKTGREQLREALDRVESVGAKCVGVVMNMVPSKGRGRRGYGYAYQYAYQYTATPERHRRRKAERAGRAGRVRK